MECEEMRRAPMGTGLSRQYGRRTLYLCLCFCICLSRFSLAFSLCVSLSRSLPPFSVVYPPRQNETGMKSVVAPCRIYPIPKVPTYLSVEPFTLGGAGA